MKKKEIYIKPECMAIQAEIEQFVCTSVVPKVPGSTEEEWEDEEIEIGEETI